MRTLHLLYHELRPGASDYSYVTECGRFAQQVEMYAAMRGDVRPEITFDDGHRSNYEYALPLLAARGLRARFFITVGWVETKPGYMNGSELRALHDAGQAIGAHGWTHTLLTHCNKAELHRELVEARQTLEDKLGSAVDTMSLPGGRSDARVLAACREAGYRTVYTSVPKMEEEPLGFTVGRLNVRGEMTPEWIASLFEPGSSTLHALARQERWKSAAKALLGDRMYGRLWALANRQEPEGEAG